jgi:AraC family transcriptional regulator
MVLQLDNSKLQHIAPDQVLAIDQSLESAQVTSDARLAAMLAAMCEEVRAGCTSGRLFGESISLALLAYLSGKYATPRTSENCDQRLSPAQKRSIVDYIRANLAANISVTELAELVQMSPSHFARMFKASFGVTPYQYVMRERIEAAKDLFARSSSSATEVAMAFGFASQSHFAKVFRQFTGVTPTKFKSGF